MVEGPWGLDYRNRPKHEFALTRNEGVENFPLKNSYFTLQAITRGIFGTVSLGTRYLTPYGRGR